jgi:hypothetical protein
MKNAYKIRVIYEIMSSAVTQTYSYDTVSPTTPI